MHDKFTEIYRPESNVATQDDYISNRESVFAQLTIGPEDIVFLGDSIFDFAEWHELLIDYHVKNRAVCGDTTHSILKRLDRIADGKPRHVVLLCGVNNFQHRIPFAKTTREYAQIVDRIRSRSQNTEIVLLPVLPVNSSLYRNRILPYHPGLNKPSRSEVVALNRFIQQLASNMPRVHYLDLSMLLDSKGELRADYTLDGLHLNGRGVCEIATKLRQLIVPIPKTTQKYVCQE